ncbi:MAG: T9SS type A sorting domain-containing protein [Bacteroidales bacterium]|nr:T9SS type A sorting domain-containing protein [Bacteroidales bacterium]
MKSLNKIVFVVILGLCSSYAFADKWAGTVNVAPVAKATGGCESARTSTDLALNNVVARVHTGGDMWWDLQGKAKYEVPRGGGIHALYCSAIWVGGKDANGQLKLAAQRYRQVGIDYWPGPLIISGAEIASVSSDICRQYDRHFCVSKQQVKDFREWYNCNTDPDCDPDPEYSVPEIIREWPAHGPVGGYDYNLAPFYDMDGDGYYDYTRGDFPYFEFATEGITEDPDCLRPRGQAARLFGDYTMWWVYNDKGNIHTETGGAAIGFEFRAQAFAFQTNDALNDMTFYNYRIINRSTYTLYNTYFGVFVDGDLGNGYDDYVGCDVQRGLGFFYNGDQEDQDYNGTHGYGSQPPAVGIDFFEGPYQDPDGMDNSTSYVEVSGKKVLDCNVGDFMNGNINGLNFGDGTVDNERWGMRRFIYFNNTTGGNTNKTDPETAVQYYNYMTGYWKDNSPLLYGGDGYSVALGADASQPTNFMFPGTSDVCGWGQDGAIRENWTEETESNDPDDRRLIQAAGPFTLTPGQVNDITIGAVWARATSGGAYASVEAVKVADDKAQILFENCFRVLDGPDAPDLNIVELDRKLIFHIYNKASSNNYLEGYYEKDPSLFCGDPDIDPCDQHYYFQGYQIFQFKDASVSMTDRYDGNKTRLVFQCDIKDDVSKLVNYTWSDDMDANVPVLEVNGENKGISHTFVVEKDFFATGDSRLINNREYYYSAIAYSFNPTMKYDQNDESTFKGQKTPYLAGRNNIKIYTATPHITSVGGTIIQGEYGYGPEITMIEGFGNANCELELKEECIEEIMSGYPWKIKERTYENGYGPINVKVIDPLSIIDDTYYVKFNVSKSNSLGIIGTNGSTMTTTNYSPFSYVVYNEAGDSVHSDAVVNLGYANEQLFMNWGFSISIMQDLPACDYDNNTYSNGLISSSITYADETKPWIYFVTDDDSYQETQGLKWTNWIKSGSFVYPSHDSCKFDDGNQDSYKTINLQGDKLVVDKDQNFEKVCGGAWAPAALANCGRYGLLPNVGSNKYPVPDVSAFSLNKSQPLASVNIVITADKSKWTRACVVEMNENEWKTNGCGWDIKMLSTNYTSYGGAKKFGLRKSPSVDKDGNPDNSGTHGMGWFPGYAINIATGERLNIMFGEDSWMTGENGCDMLWNPTSHYADNHYNPILGGKHYIYVMANTIGDNDGTGSNAPAYDSCKYLYEQLLKYENGDENAMRTAWKTAMWTAIPMQSSRFDFLATDVTIKIRTSMPYYQAKKDMAIANPVNDNAPLFRFSTSDIKTIFDDQETAENALDLIRVVPNPYYGSSYYESNQLDNIVRITNLPKTCTISIYNINGTLIRRFKKDTESTFIEWDLTNSANIVISSGVYLIHVNAPGIGQKVLKWFGSLRPTDLNNF